MAVTKNNIEELIERILPEQVAQAYEALEPYCNPVTVELHATLVQGRNYIPDRSRAFPYKQNNISGVIAQRISRAICDSIEILPARLASEIAASETDHLAMIKLMGAEIIGKIETSNTTKLYLLAIKAQNEMLKYRGGVITSKDVKEILNVEQQTVNDKRKRQELLAIKTSTGYKYPVWQFVNRKILKDLKIVLKMLSKDNDPWMQLRFFIGINDYLKVNLPDSPNVIDALQSGNVEMVKKAIYVYMKHEAI